MSARSWWRGRRLVVALVAVFVLVYGSVVALYALNDRTVATDGCPAEAPADEILVRIQPTAVDAAADRMVVTFDVLSFGPVADPVTALPTDDLTVYISGTDGQPVYEIAADQIPSPITPRLITDGYIERWPFDLHTAEWTVVAARDVNGIPTAVPVSLCGSAHVPGWGFDSEQIEGTDEVVVNGNPVDQVRLTAHRSVATVAFGLVILVLMIVLPVLSLIVAILAYRGKRKVEATLTSWMAAMLFATIPLRTFLPGSPPIGSWIDYLIVLWVLAGLVLGLVIYVAAWVRWTPPGPSVPPNAGA